MARAGLALVLVLVTGNTAQASLIESRAQSKALQRAVRHRQVVAVVEGVRQRMTGTPSPDPLLLINFPEIDTQFKIHLLEETNTLKITLAQNDIDSKCRHLEYSCTNRLRRCKFLAAQSSSRSLVVGCLVRLSDTFVKK